METLKETGTAEKYIELFRQNRGLIINGDPGFLSDMREEAILSFEKTGFPKKRQDVLGHYKYILWKKRKRRFFLKNFAIKI